MMNIIFPNMGILSGHTTNLKKITGHSIVKTLLILHSSTNNLTLMYLLTTIKYSKLLIH